MVDALELMDAITSTQAVSKDYMGRYNNFMSEVECPTCHQVSEIAFQSDVGRLEWTRFYLGDKVFGNPPQTKAAPIAPEAGLENAHFWAHAIGTCLNCKSDVFARIEIRSNKVDKIVPVPSPPDAESFDFLNKWGLIDQAEE